MKNMRWLLALMLVLAVMLAGCAESAEDVAGNVAPNQAATEAAEEKPVSLGRMDGGVYTNSYAGFGCTLDDSWTFYSAEELQALPENVNEVLKDTEIGDAMEGVEQITDMMAENMETFSSMNLLYQKMDAQTRLVYGMMSEESIADAMLAQSDTMIAAYAQPAWT